MTDGQRRPDDQQSGHRSTSYAVGDTSPRAPADLGILVRWAPPTSPGPRWWAVPPRAEHRAAPLVTLAWRRNGFVRRFCPLGPRGPPVPSAQVAMTARLPQNTNVRPGGTSRAIPAREWGESARKVT